MPVKALDDLRTFYTSSSLFVRHARRTRRGLPCTYADSVRIGMKCLCLGRDSSLDRLICESASDKFHIMSARIDSCNLFVWCFESLIEGGSRCWIGLIKRSCNFTSEYDLMSHQWSRDCSTCFKQPTLPVLVRTIYNCLLQGKISRADIHKVQSTDPIDAQGQVKWKLGTWSHRPYISPPTLQGHRI
jgi:hypothetical protein